MSDTLLFELAAAAGISRHWISADGQACTVTPDTLRALLQALELPCATPEEIMQSRAARAAEADSAHLPPLLSVRAGQALCVGGSGQPGTPYRIQFEQGGEQTGWLESKGGATLLPAVAHWGYHRLQVADQEVTLAVAPARCFGVTDALRQQAVTSACTQPVPPSPRLWGVAAQLYSLRRDGGGGMGDYSALASLTQTAARQGAAAVAISPVHALFNARPNHFSPYSPSSRLFLNAWHIDPAAVLGDAALAQALSALGPQAAQQRARLEQAEMVDWPAASMLQMQLLRQLFQQFQAQCATGQAAGLDADFRQFCQQGGEALHDHACFEALDAHFHAQGQGSHWRDWPAELRDPHTAAVAQFAAQYPDEIAFHSFLQWQAARGLAAAQAAARQAGMPIGLIADLAVGAETSGSQAWSRQHAMLNGLSVGAPPDHMNILGQNWGLGAFSPRALRQQGYAPYLEMLRAVMTQAGGVRIDHVLGLARMWLVPEGANATEGAYLAYPLDDLLNLIALESWRHHAIVIGEDLGTVPEGFRERLHQAGLLGIGVLLFERDGTRFKSPSEWPNGISATTTTHDTPTLAGWWQGHDIGWRARLQLLAKGSSEEQEQQLRQTDRSALWQVLIDNACASGPLPDQHQPAPIASALCLLGQTAAPLVMLPLEDALCLAEQPNLPGTVAVHPNWCRRLPLTVAQLDQDPSFIASVAALRGARASSLQNP